MTSYPYRSSKRMIEVVACDVDGAELPELGRRFHDRAVPEVLIDGTAYDFVRFIAPGVALYRRRPVSLDDESCAVPGSAAEPQAATSLR